LRVTYVIKLSGFPRGSAKPPAAESASLIEDEACLELKKVKGDNLGDFDCGSGFQPRLILSGRYHDRG